MYNIVFTAFRMLSALVQGYCLQYFYGNFLENRTDSRFHGWYVAGAYGLLQTVFHWLPPEGYDSISAVWKILLSLCILAALAVCFYQAFHAVTIFLVISFRAMVEISTFMALILIDKPGKKLLLLWNWCVGKGIITSEKTFEMTMKASIIGMQLLGELVIVLLLFLTVKRIVKDFREKDYRIHKTELIFIVIPAVTGLMLCTLLRMILFTAEDKAVEIIYDRYPLLLIILPIILILSLLSILYGVKLFQDMMSLNRERSSRIVLERQLEDMQEHMREIERIDSGIRSMKHDMKNTLAVIRQLAAKDGENKQGELQAYLSGLNDAFTGLELRFQTGNRVADTVLNMKYHEASRIMPDLQVDAGGLVFPENLAIQGYDLGIILGNAMDNAIEACRKQKDREGNAVVFIRLGSFYKGNLLFLKIENSFYGRLVQKRRSELPETDKADKKTHGMGLANIKHTAEKYQGTMDYKVDGRVFILSVMMKNEPQPEQDQLMVD